MILLLLSACEAAPVPESDRTELEGPCAATPDWSGAFYGWPHFIDGGDLEGDGAVDLDLNSVGGVVGGTLVLSGDVSVQGAPIPDGHGWQVEVEGSSCWDDEAEEDLTIRLASPVVESLAGWIEATAGHPLCDAWFPDGDDYEYVEVMQGPDVVPFFGGIE